ncbi:uncharacterized protein LOC121071097 isoform X6 [Cygnus olor]|uniref:uncharacterized protein LOC121071097 isoform X6 n=1 Tax=Cygnus olor TaxID=8869 RepID=UPI001ADEBCF0|nr:uncharacterized protein LOC121071097 isoform X6 [Cygnus olor]
MSDCKRFSQKDSKAQRDSWILEEFKNVNPVCAPVGYTAPPVGTTLTGDLCSEGGCLVVWTLQIAGTITQSFAPEHTAGQRPLFPEKNVPKREELVTWEELPFAVADRLSLTEHVLYANLEGSSRLINLYS